MRNGSSADGPAGRTLFIRSSREEDEEEKEEEEEEEGDGHFSNVSHHLHCSTMQCYIISHQVGREKRKRKRKVKDGETGETRRKRVKTVDW